MVTDDDLRHMVHLDDKEGQGLVVLLLAPAEEDPPQLLIDDGVIRLLEVDEGCIVSLLLALPRVDLGYEPRNMSEG